MPTCAPCRSARPWHFWVCHLTRDLEGTDMHGIVTFFELWWSLLVKGVCVYIYIVIYLFIYLCIYWFIYLFISLCQCVAKNMYVITGVECTIYSDLMGKSIWWFKNPRIRTIFFHGNLTASWRMLTATKEHERVLAAVLPPCGGQTSKWP